MGAGRIVGIALLALGIILLFFGFAAATSLLERFTKSVTGEYTNQTMWYIVGGVVSSVVGLALMLFGGRRESI